MYDNKISDEWRICSIFQNNNHELRFVYKNGDNASVIPFFIIANENGINSIYYNNDVSLPHTVYRPGATPPDIETRSTKYVGYSSGIPTAGIWKIGDILFNTNPTTGYVGWVCTASGAPGSWKKFGKIEN